MAGALLLMFGVRHLLKVYYPPRIFVWVLPLCAAFGAVVVSGILHTGTGWISSCIFQGAHLLWQAVVAVALAKSVAASEETPAGHREPCA